MSKAAPLPVATAPSAPAAEAAWAGYGLAAGGAALFSTKAILVKLMYAAGATPEMALALRVLIALPFFIAIGVMEMRKRQTRGEAMPAPGLVVKTAGVGLIGYWLASWLDFEGLVYVTAQFERLVLFTYPLFVMILGWLFFGGRLTAIGLGGLAISYLGLAIVFRQGLEHSGDDVVTGGLYVLGAAFAFASYQVMAKPLIGKLGSGLFTSIAMIAASLMVLAHVGFDGGFDFAIVTPWLLVLGILIAIFATVLPSFLMNAAIGRIGATSNAMIGTLSPLATVVMAVFILGEPFGPIDALGTALVIIGIGAYTLIDARAKAK
jgi:drug/metabolite transporter (DMT)-like permease